MSNNLSEKSIDLCNAALPLNKLTVTDHVIKTLAGGGTGCIEKDGDKTFLIFDGIELSLSDSRLRIDFIFGGKAVFSMPIERQTIENGNTTTIEGIKGKHEVAFRGDFERHCAPGFLSRLKRLFKATL